MNLPSQAIAAVPHTLARILKIHLVRTVFLRIIMVARKYLARMPAWWNDTTCGRLWATDVDAFSIAGLP